MLSGHSFNALLKTLEEPPAHVKFLLATTDPQKLPMTILSRCLQFNLKRLLPDLIRAQLKKILDTEEVQYDEAALALLARSADGSMRDALSLLDQAIAFGGGKVVEPDVRDMLGTIDQDAVERLLQALTDANARALLTVVADVSEQSTDYDAVLSELLLSLHQISLAQVDPALIGNDNGNRERILAHAHAMTREDVQLYYQIGLIGRRDLTLTPDMRTGLEMILLRMLAFRPAAALGGQPVAEVESVDRPAISVEAADRARASESWTDVVRQLKITGLVSEMANNSMLESYEQGEMLLVLDEGCAQLYSKERESALKDALERFYGTPLRLKMRVGQPQEETPAQQRSRLQDAQQQAAFDAIYNDPNVKALEQRFNARVTPGSVRPKALSSEDE